MPQAWSWRVGPRLVELFYEVLELLDGATWLEEVSQGECPSPPTSLLLTHCDQLPHTATVLSPLWCCIPSNCEPIKPFLPCLSNILSWLCHNEEELQLTSSAFLPQPLSKTVTLKYVMWDLAIEMTFCHTHRSVSSATIVRGCCRWRQKQRSTTNCRVRDLEHSVLTGLSPSNPTSELRKLNGGDRETVWPSGDREDQGHGLFLTRQD